MNLNDVHRGIKRNRKAKRVGRGPGSGHGRTAGRGNKGQKSRSGETFSPTFEGGQLPLAQRIPKRGFNNRWADSVVIVNVAQLNAAFQDGEEVTPASLQIHNLAKGRYDILKVLGDGELTKKLKVSAHRFSKSAVEKIQQAGGETVVLPGKKPVVKNKMKAPRG